MKSWVTPPESVACSRNLTFASPDPFATFLCSALCPQRLTVDNYINGLIALWVPVEFGQWQSVAGD